MVASSIHALDYFRTSCGRIPIDYPFGIDDCCGSPYYRRLLELRTPSGRYRVRNINYLDPHMVATDPSMLSCEVKRFERRWGHLIFGDSTPKLPHNFRHYPSITITQISIFFFPMTGEAPSWADQWGTGGMGLTDYEDEGYSRSGEVGHNRKNKSKAAFDKAKAAASSGAHKIKLGTSSSFKWIKNQCQKKGSSK